MSEPVTDRQLAVRVTVAVIGGIVALLLVIFGTVAAGKSFSRYQTRQDAANRVKVSAIEIRNQEQRVEVAKQQAEIRLQKVYIPSGANGIPLVSTVPTGQVGGPDR